MNLRPAQSTKSVLVTERNPVSKKQNKNPKTKTKIPKQSRTEEAWAESG